jgi:hypothetical protein
VRSIPARSRPQPVPAATSCDPYTALAGRILERGEPCRAAILQIQALGLRNPQGDDMYALMLTLLDGVGPGCPIWVGDAVPARALSMLRRGEILPAKRLADGDDRDVAIDWTVALMRPTTKAA